MKRLAAALLVLGLLAAGAAQARPAEVVYQIFTRSFRDSNGDRDGDLDGIRQSLPYLKSLGVTTVLLTPIQPSPFYHNYFPSGLGDVDPSFGDEAAFRRLIGALHGSGIKLYLDEEFQYVAEGHPWLAEVREHPERLLTNPATRGREGYYSGVKLRGWNGAAFEVATVNLADPEVREHFARTLARQARQGVDGFRLDHMMDDLDNKHLLTNLFASFWRPILARVRAARPDVTFVAEQADWGDLGHDWLTRGGVDAVFAMPLRFAIVSFDKAKIDKTIAETAAATPAGKRQFIQIENHDTDRFASVTASDPAKERLGAAFDLFLEGTPLIYYGQELGMRGAQQHNGATDANDIPQREAFRWAANEKAAGAAIWYAGDYPWWTGRYNRSRDGVSVAEETRDPGSLLNWYRRLIGLRRARPEWVSGDQTVLCGGIEHVVCILRTAGHARSLMIANLAAQPATLTLSQVDPALARQRWTPLARNAATLAVGSVKLGPYGVAMLGAGGGARR